MNSRTDDVVLDGHRLEYAWHGPLHDEAATLVFLHQGLGSVSMWRDFPVTLAERTGCGALVYSRRGHGQSDRWDEPRSVRFMHDEALATLPRLLERLGVAAPIIVGHSDGGSIGLIYAGAQAGPLLGLILEAPHVFVEDLSVTSITAARTAFEDGDLRTRFQRHHGDNTDGVFRGWNDVWLSAEFRSWNIEDSLAGILVQTLVIQGRDDEYGTLAQVEAIAAQTHGSVETLLLDECQHSPHRERRADVIDAMSSFVRARANEAH